MVSVSRCTVTKRQAEVLAAIDRLSVARGAPPTLRELAVELDITSPNGVASHLRTLRRKGLVDWDEGRSRTLRRAIPTSGIPILGLVR